MSLLFYLILKDFSEPLVDFGLLKCYAIQVLVLSNFTSDKESFLQVLEPRFGAELFASILSIPASKTLLRRHLSTHFVTLVGNEVQHGKREIEQQPGYVPLTPNQKVKVRALHGKWELRR